MSEQENNKATKVKREIVKSPKYPYITFQDALSKTKVVYKEERRAATTAPILYKHLGYTKKTGSSGRVVAALKQYGLIDETNGSYKISDQAFRLFNLPEGSPEIDQIESEMAMRPRLFREVLAHYSDGLPSDATLKSYLILDKAFNENGADIFIKVFKAALQVTKGKPIVGDTDFDQDDEENESSNESQIADRADLVNSAGAGKSVANVATPQQSTSPVSVIPPPISETESELKITFGPDGRPQLNFIGLVTKDSLSILQGLVNLRPDILERDVVEKAEPQKEEQSFPTAAIWRNKDFDQPVKVTGEAGVKDGKKYYTIDGSDTAIPGEELDFD